MPKKWTNEDKLKQYNLLKDMYVSKNKTIKEIGQILNVSEKTIFKRLKMLEIKTDPSKKKHYCNKCSDLIIPKNYSVDLAEFFGIMLGDGSLSKFQVMVTLGNKEKEYVLYVQKKMRTIFKTKVAISVREKGYHDVYIGSVELSKWLQKEGLVFNKVKSQVSAPDWIYKNDEYCKAFLRGFFDTDGSVYSLKYGIQISLTNKSLPLLKSLQKMLSRLEYNVSEISSSKVYLTNKEDVYRFFKEIKPKNRKHIIRFQNIRKI